MDVVVADDKWRQLHCRESVSVCVSVCVCLCVCVCDSILVFCLQPVEVSLYEVSPPALYPEFNKTSSSQTCMLVIPSL